MNLKFQLKTFDFLDFCELDYEHGNCFDQRTYYYYDKHDGVCKSFIYSGCGGNQNRFQNQQECIEKCGEAQG